MAHLDPGDYARAGGWRSYECSSGRRGLSLSSSSVNALWMFLGKPMRVLSRASYTVGGSQVSHFAFDCMA